MSELSLSQRKTRDRVESLIRLMAPALDYVLAAGDRISRLVEPEDYEHYPVRPVGNKPLSGSPPARPLRDSQR